MHTCNSTFFVVIFVFPAVNCRFYSSFSSLFSFFARLNLFNFVTFHRMIFLTSIYLIIYFLLLLAALVPSAPPQNISVISLDEHSVLLQWSAPLEGSRNGNLTSYTAYCKANTLEDAVAKSMLVSSTTYTTFFKNLQPFTKYAVWITASTVAGEGPKSEDIFVITDESSG